MVLVERAHHGRADGQVAGPVEVAAGEQPERGLVQDRLGGGREPPSFGEQPGLEGLGVRDGEAVEQVLTEPGQADRGSPVAVHQQVDVEGRVGRKGDPHRVAVEDGRRAEGPADLGEAPPQRPERVVGLGEEERGEPAA